MENYQEPRSTQGQMARGAPIYRGATHSTVNAGRPIENIPGMAPVSPLDAPKMSQIPLAALERRIRATFAQQYSGAPSPVQ